MADTRVVELVLVTPTGDLVGSLPPFAVAFSPHVRATTSLTRVSDAVNGKRAMSKAQAKRLGGLFHLSPAAFI